MAKEDQLGKTENLSIDTAVLTEKIKEPPIWFNFFLKVVYFIFLNLLFLF